METPPVPTASLSQSLSPGDEESGDSSDPGGAQGCWTIFYVTVVMIGMFVDAVLLTVLVPLTPQLMDRFQVSDAQIGILFAAKAIVQIVSSPLVAKVIDRAGPRIVTSLACGVLVVSTTVYASSGNSYWQALAARAAQGLASSGILVGGQSGITSLTKGNEGALLSTATLGAALGVLLGPTVGGSLAAPNALGLDGMFWCLAGVTACVFVLNVSFYYLILPKNLADRVSQQFQSTDGGEQSTRIGTRAILRMPVMWLLLFANFGVNFSIAMLEPVVPTRAVKQFDIDPTQSGQLGLMWAAAPIGFIAFTPIAGMLADKCRKNFITGLGLLIKASGLALMGAASQDLGGIVLFEVALVLCGMGYALTNNTAMAAVPAITGEGKAAGFAALDMSEQLGFMCGPILGASFGIGSGFWTLILTTSGVLVAGSLAMFFSNIPQPSAEETN